MTGHALLDHVLGVGVRIGGYDRHPQTPRAAGTVSCRIPRVERVAALMQIDGDAGAVRAARLARGLSQEDLAAESGLDRTYISGLERGARNPALSTIEKVSRALQVRVSVLMVQAETDARD